MFFVTLLVFWYEAQSTVILPGDICPGPMKWQKLSHENLTVFYIHQCDLFSLKYRKNPLGEFFSGRQLYFLWGKKL